MQPAQRAHGRCLVCAVLCFTLPAEIPFLNICLLDLSAMDSSYVLVSTAGTLANHATGLSCLVGEVFVESRQM
uniref:Putative secreted protein n=1 Tax=Anopheles triannulatus TaxID=58253 RepID=A0A2M4B7Q3_9DIPT